jgi:hypothetical protein
LTSHNGNVHEGEIVPHDSDPLARLAQVDAPMVRVADMAEVDVQISTAKRYPRAIGRFRSTALGMVTLNEEIAAGCFYALNRQGKAIEGASIRMAEIVASAWGNLRCGARVCGIEDREVVAEGVCWDLEANIVFRMETRRRITNRQGQRYGDDMIVMTGNAACSIAVRNAILRVVPMVYVEELLEAAKKVVRGDEKTLAVRRVDALRAFTAMGASEARVLARLGRASVEEIGLDDLVTLRGLRTSIKEKHATIDEVFPEASVEKKAGGLNGELAKLAAPVPKGVDVPQREATDSAVVEATTAAAPAPLVEATPEPSPLDPVRSAIRLWAEDAGRPRPSDDECNAAAEAFAKFSRLGPIASILKDHDATSAFVTRAMASSVKWEKHLPAPPAMT